MAASDTRPTTTAATEAVDYDAVTSIRQEGFHHSQVMQILSELTDRIGPRLTGSPNMKQANECTRAKLNEYGLSNAHLEKWGPFGRGWSEEFTSVRMTAPTTATLFPIPRAWTPSRPRPGPTPLAPEDRSGHRCPL